MKQAFERESGLLYLVATPIGNLGDMSHRAVEVLKKVDLIACEDTRRSRSLLDEYGIDRPLVPLHEHNEDKAAPGLLSRLQAGESIALISDAGTPLINDPGFPLVRLVREAGIRVTPIPGACALIAALCASGLPTHRFAFEGFPPRKTSARIAFFETLRHDPHTLVFYESSHRIEETLHDLARVFPSSRRLVVARELTKFYETLVSSTVGEACSLLEADPEMRLGEFVLMVEGDRPASPEEGLTPQQQQVLSMLLEECSVKTAATLTAKITGARREQAYRLALEIKSEGKG